MHPIPKRRGFSEVGKAMLVTGFVLLVSTAALLFSAEGHLKDSNAAVHRASIILGKINAINSLVIGVDYSARGYALTGQPLFLQHEREKQRLLKTAVRDLSAMLGDKERAGIGMLAALADDHAKVYADFVRLGPGRVKEMGKIITSPTERQKRHAVLSILGRLHKAELDELYARQADAERQLHRTSILTFVIVGLAFLGGTSDVMARLWTRRRKANSELDGSE